MEGHCRYRACLGRALARPRLTCRRAVDIDALVLRY
ncbi:protein of unknown function [Thauera humireducens]|nr:protein of unknown function [Thauera humireducens]